MKILQELIGPDIGNAQGSMRVGIRRDQEGIPFTLGD